MAFAKFGRYPGHVDALMKARYLVANGIFEHVCNALKDVGTSAAMEVVERIGRAIAPHYTINEWLEEEQGVPENQAYDDPLMTTYRLRWIDWMIEGYKNAR